MSETDQAEATAVAPSEASNNVDDFDTAAIFPSTSSPDILVPTS